jgi:hypothetical protein
MEEELGRPLSVAEVCETVKGETEGVFEVDLVPRALSELDIVLGEEEPHE